MPSWSFGFEGMCILCDFLEVLLLGYKWQHALFAITRLLSIWIELVFPTPALCEKGSHSSLFSPACDSTLSHSVVSDELYLSTVYAHISFWVSLFLTNYVYVSVCRYRCVSARVSIGQRVGASGAGVPGSCEMLQRCWPCRKGLCENRKCSSSLRHLQCLSLPFLHVWSDVFFMIENHFHTFLVMCIHVKFPISSFLFEKILLSFPGWPRIRNLSASDSTYCRCDHHTCPMFRFLLSSEFSFAILEALPLLGAGLPSYVVCCASLFSHFDSCAVTLRVLGVYFLSCKFQIPLFTTFMNYAWGLLFVFRNILCTSRLKGKLSIA